MVGRAGLFQRRVPIEFRMWRGVIAAVKNLLVRLLLAVIGKWLAGDLPSAQTTPVGEGGQKNRVDRPALLKQVEHLFNSLIDKRNGADLNADDLFGGLDCTRDRGSEGRSDHGGRGNASGGLVQKFPAGQSV